MIFPLKDENIGRLDHDKSIAEVRLRYNDQPKPHEKCTCGKNKKYFRCCGKTSKVKHAEMVIKFISKEDTKEHHLELTANGVFLYTDGEIAVILSSELRTTYEREEKKGPKVVNKISIPGLIPLVTPDNIFNYFDIVLAVDTNTDMENKISVCSVVSVNPDKKKNSSTFSIDPNKGISAGKLAGGTIQEAIFAFKATDTKNENTAWYVVTEFIRRYSALGDDKIYALVVDSDLAKIDEYNHRLLPYVKNYFLPKGMCLIYASSDFKNNSLLNYAIHFSDKNSRAVLKDEKENIINRLQEKSSSEKISIDCLFLNQETKIFTMAIPEIKNKDY